VIQSRTLEGPCKALCAELGAEGEVPTVSRFHVCAVERETRGLRVAARRSLEFFAVARAAAN
jgi:hypothetical protein